MAGEDTEKRFQSIMDKLFNSPKPKSLNSSRGDQSSPGQKRAHSVMSGSSNNSGRKIVPFGRFNQSGSSSSTTTSGAPMCRPWDRADLLRRLATFKSMTWFGKPKVVSAVNCARRGWVNVEMDIIACEACGARLLFSTPSSWSQQQIEKAAAVFSLKLDSGHRLICPWINNACDEALTQFPPTSAAALVDDYRERSSTLLQLSAVPVVSSSAIDYMRSPQLEHFLKQTSLLEFGTGSENATRIECVGNETSVNTYYQAVRLISLCGWEPRVLPFVVDCRHQPTQTAEKGHPKEISHIVNEQSPGVTMNVVSGSDEEINECHPPLGEQQYDPASVVLDCGLCGASVGLWAFSTISRPLELFRIVDSSDGNHQNDSANRDNNIMTWIAGSPRTDNCVKDDHVGGKMGIMTLSKERPVSLNLSIAGGPPPAKQNYRTIVSLPIISRNLRAVLSSNSGVRHPAMSNASSVHQEPTLLDSWSNNSCVQVEGHTTRGERNEDGIGNFSGDNQSHLNPEFNDKEPLRIKKNSATHSEGTYLGEQGASSSYALDECAEIRPENPMEISWDMPHERGGSAENADMGVKSNSQVNECCVILHDSNGALGNRETNHAHDFLVENPIKRSSEMPHDDGGSTGNADMLVENNSQVNAIVPDTDDAILNKESNNNTSMMITTAEVCSHQLNSDLSETHHDLSAEAKQEFPLDACCQGSHATTDISSKMNPQKDDPSANYQMSLCVPGSGVTEKHLMKSSVDNEVVAANELAIALVDTRVLKYPKLAKAGRDLEFDPIRQHRHFCPWIISTGKVVPGWQQLLSSLDRGRESSSLSSSKNLSLAMLEVDDPITSVRNLFMSPSSKRMKTTHDSR